MTCQVCLNTRAERRHLLRSFSEACREEFEEVYKFDSVGDRKGTPI